MLQLDNETWLLEAGDAVIIAKAERGLEALSDLERLVYCLWVADYGMRNAGDLETARDLYADFMAVGLQAAINLHLSRTIVAFSLSEPEFQASYFDRFGTLCDELRSA